MSEANDPEERLAEALRAHAAQTPPAGSIKPLAGARRFEEGQWQPGLLSDSNFELLSGNEYAGNYRAGYGESTQHEPPRPAAVAPTPAATSPATPARRGQLSAVWMLVLAVLLGLAAGAVAGTLTMVP